jgi:hypothetical protein
MGSQFIPFSPHVRCESFLRPPIFCILLLKTFLQSTRNIDEKHSIELLQNRNLRSLLIILTLINSLGTWIQNKKKPNQTVKTLFDSITVWHTKSKFSTTKMETSKYHYFHEHFAPRVQCFQIHSTINSNIFRYHILYLFQSICYLRLSSIFRLQNTVNDGTKKLYTLALQALCNSL